MQLPIKATILKWGCIHRNSRSLHPLLQFSDKSGINFTGYHLKQSNQCKYTNHTHRQNRNTHTCTQGLGVVKFHYQDNTKDNDT